MSQTMNGIYQILHKASYLLPLDGIYMCTGKGLKFLLRDVSNYLCYTLTWMHTTDYTMKNSVYQQLLASQWRM